MADIRGPEASDPRYGENEDDRKMAVKMSVVGLDLTNDDLFYAAATLADEIRFRQIKNADGQLSTPAAISFNGGQRYTGIAAIGKEGCFRDVMKVIGKTIDELEVDGLGHLVEINSTTNLLQVRALGLSNFTPTHVLAMLLSDLKGTADKNLGTIEKEYCIGIPGYFTQSQCLAVRQAAKIAGLASVHLVNGTTASGLGYEVLIRKSTKNQNVVMAVVDFGNTACHVSVINLKDKKLEVLSYAHDSSIGESQILRTLVQHLPKESIESHGLLQKLRRLIEEPLKPNDLERTWETITKRLSVSLLSNFKDIAQPVQHKVELLLQKALNLASLQKTQVDEVLLIGRGFQICSIRDCLRKFLGIELNKFTYRPSGFFANGCAIYAAIKSKRFAACSEVDKCKKLKKLLVGFIIANERELQDEISIPLVKLANAADCRIKFAYGRIKLREEETCVLDAACGRIKLTEEEMHAACEKERKMSLPKAIRDKIYCLLTEMQDFATDNEKTNLRIQQGVAADVDQLKNYFKAVLDGVDPSFSYDRLLKQLLPVEECIVARQFEQKYKAKLIKGLQETIKQSRSSLVAFRERDARYITILESAIEEFKKQIDGAEVWLKNKAKKLSEQAKTDNAINFIEDAKEKINGLQTAWLETQEKRVALIQVLKSNVMEDKYMVMLEKFCLELLKGNTKPETILGCRLLPLQTDFQGHPNTWISWFLKGREPEEEPNIFVKQHNAYMMGLGNSNGIFEFGTGRKHTDFTHTTIPGAKHLKIHCDYISLLNPERLPWQIDDYLDFVEKMLLDHCQLLNSIHIFASWGDVIHKDSCSLCSSNGALSYAAVCISFMLLEASRMTGVSNGVHDGQGFLGIALKRIMMRYIWRWGDMSFVLRMFKEDPERARKLLKDSSSLRNEIDKETVEDLSGIVRLVLNKFAGELDVPAVEENNDDNVEPATDPPPSSHGPPGQHPPPPPPPTEPGDDGDNEGQQPLPTRASGGQTLVEIFGVLVHKETQSEIHCIVVHEGRGPHIIYLRSDKGKVQSKDPDSELTALPLSGPTIAILHQHGSKCSLEFSGHDNKPNDSILCLSDWCPYDEYQSRFIRYGNAGLEVHYALWTEAVEANVSIGLVLPMKTKSDARITGRITMTTSHSGSSPEIVLFEVSRANGDFPESSSIAPFRRHRRQLYEALSLQISLRLLRSCVVVKLGSEVSIHGYLNIDGVQSDISQRLAVPTKVDIAKNVNSDWWYNERAGTGYSINLNLINRPVF